MTASQNFRQETAAPGILRRKYRDGGIKYVVRVRVKGHPTLTQTFTRLTDAKLWQRHTIADIEAGRALPLPKSQGKTFNELAETYRVKVLSLDNSPYTKETSAKLTWWQKRIGAYYFARFNTDTAILEACIEEWRAGERSNATVRRYAATLSTLFSYAIKKQWRCATTRRHCLPKRGGWYGLPMPKTPKVDWY